MRRKVFPGTEISLADRRDLGERDNFYPIGTQLSRLAGKLSVYTLQNLHHSRKLYPVRGKTFLHMNRTTLFDLSKCFLGNRDNFCPYEQALSRMNHYIHHYHMLWKNSCFYSKKVQKYQQSQFLIYNSKFKVTVYGSVWI